MVFLASVISRALFFRLIGIGIGIGAGCTTGVTNGRCNGVTTAVTLLVGPPLRHAAGCLRPFGLDFGARADVSEDGDRLAVGAAREEADGDEPI